MNTLLIIFGALATLFFIFYNLDKRIKKSVQSYIGSLLKTGELKSIKVDVKEKPVHQSLINIIEFLREQVRSLRCELGIAQEKLSTMTTKCSYNYNEAQQFKKDHAEAIETIKNHLARLDAVKKDLEEEKTIHAAKDEALEIVNKELDNTKFENENLKVELSAKIELVNELQEKIRSLEAEPAPAPEKPIRKKK